MANIFRLGGGGSSKSVRVEWIIGENQTINFKKGEFKYAEICVFGARIEGTNAADSSVVYVSTSSGINKSYSINQNSFTRETFELGQAINISINFDSGFFSQYITGRVVIVLHNDKDKKNWFSWY